jgi:hypothetical protein
LRDVINDFQQGQDLIDLGAVDADAGAAGNQAFSFIGQAAFSAAGQVRWFHENGHTIVEVNSQGPQGAEMQIDLLGQLTLAASDFIL